MAMAMKSVVGLSSLQTGRAGWAKTGLSGQRLAMRHVSVGASRKVTSMSGKPFDRDWISSSPFAFMMGFIGWTAPSSIGVPAYDGNSLFGSLLGQIVKEWQHFPTGPALDSPFWLYLITWHLGLFVTLTLAQIGFNGNKQGYFD